MEKFDKQAHRASRRRFFWIPTWGLEWLALWLILLWIGVLWLTKLESLSWLDLRPLEWLVISVVWLLLFGPWLPHLGRALGRWIVSKTQN